jgi:hypothetical protein
VVAAVKQTRPNLGRILERKARLVNFDERIIKLYVPAGGLREPKEIIADFINEMQNISGEKWVIEQQLATQVDLSIQTLHEKQVNSKQLKLDEIRQNPTVRKIIADLVSADIVDFIAK